jgi:hypothetical protein
VTGNVYCLFSVFSNTFVFFISSAVLFRCIILTALNAYFLIHIAVKDFLRPLDELGARNEHDVTAPAAFDPHIGSELHDFPLVGTAGMFFLHLYDIANFVLNKFHDSLRLITHA